MLIKLTLTHNKTEFYIRAADIRTIERNPQNVLETYVSTTLMTPQGPLTYGVMETPDAIASAVAEALKTQSPVTAGKVIH